MASNLPGYSHRRFGAPIRGGHRITHSVYTRGKGPPIVLIQELPGIERTTLELAERLCSSGFQVVLPHLFGPLGRISLAGNLARVMCMRREFALLAQRRSSPIVDWLRALCRDVRERAQSKGVGLIGMCLTGNFALSLIGDESVLAAVASQPSMPLFAPGALHMDNDELAAARTALDRDGPMLALRFERDVLCSAAKFDAIDAAFNDDRERVRLMTMPGLGHSVLTRNFVNKTQHPTHEALQAVLSYFDKHLRTPWLN